jgi:cell division protein FtsI/penicillin-binding protein 2
MLTKLLVAGALAGTTLALISGQGAAEEPRARAQSTGASEQSAPAAKTRKPTRSELLEGLDPLEHRRKGDVFVSSLPEGRRAVLSLEPGLQRHIEDRLAHYEVPYASLVAIEPGTGRVLAYVSHSSANPKAADLARDPTPPTASVFKVVTGAALLDAGVEPGQEVCYGGGASKLTAADLEDDPDRDKWCTTFAKAMGRSVNAVFAKLADRHLDKPTLERYAAAFGFGHSLPFDVPTKPSPAEVPSDRLERARTAAGFWHMHMSPLHGAIVASTIANDGVMQRPTMVRHIEGPDGQARFEHEPKTFRRVIPRHTARTLAEMMTRTVDHGTARSWFHDPEGREFLPDVDVAGKTGTLTGEKPYRGYNWFVGFAPVDDPEIAVASLVVNKPKWRIKAGYTAREAIRWYLHERPEPEQPDEPASQPTQGKAPQNDQPS